LSQRISSAKTKESVPQKHVEEKKASKKKKSVSGSITSLMTVIDGIPVAKESIAHFQKMCSVPQTGNNVRPSSDFERTSSKSHSIKASKGSHKKLNAEDRARMQFCVDNDMTIEQYNLFMTGELELPKAEVAWTYKPGEDLVRPDQIPHLPTRMRQLHEWYKTQTGNMIGVFFKSSDIFKTEGSATYWVEFSSLFELYQKQALDVSIMGLFTL